MDHQKNKVKHFLKLGYSHSDILRVLRSLQHDAQTNDILEELIKTCRTTAGGHTGAERALSSSPQLVPRGCASPKHLTQTDTRDLGYMQHNADGCSQFRPVVIDGSNVALSHGNKRVFSCWGIQLAVLWFWDRGIRDITVFVPMWRKEQSRPEAPITDQHILNELEQKSILVYTPSRCIKGKRVVCYDDRYIVKLAYDSDGIIVSNDVYRDLQLENPQWKKFIEERLLMYSFVNDMFLPPDDPLGRNGPKIENFLRKTQTGSDNKQQHCPYGKKCTYGAKCKFYHPERSSQPQLSVADELRAKSQPDSGTKEFSPSTHLAHDRYVKATPSYTCNTTNESAPHARHEAAALFSSAHLDGLDYDLSELDLYSSPKHSRTYLQRSLPILWKSCSSIQSDDSLESTSSRPYYSDSAIQTSLAYSSGSSSESGSDYFLSHCSHGGPRRAYSQGGAAFSNGQHAYSDSSLRWSCTPCPLHRYVPDITSNRLRSLMLYSGLLPQQASYCGPSEVSWGDHLARDTDKLKQEADRRREVRSQLSTIFPQNVVDKVMRLYPNTLDTPELIGLMGKYRNSQLQ